MKGHLKSRSIKSHSIKLNTKSVRKPKQKLKNHKGLLKRVKIVIMLIVRWVHVGIGSSNSNHQGKATCSATRAEPIWWERDKLVTCTRQTCSKLRDSFHISRGSLWRWDIDIYWLVWDHKFLASIDFIRAEKSFFLLPLTCKMRSRSWTDPPYMNISYRSANYLSGSCSSFIMFSGLEKLLFTKVM